MQLLNATGDSTLSVEVVPADLKDASGEVYKDKLFNIYTVSRSVDDTSIGVTTKVIATDLVKHEGISGEKGYWCGIAIIKDFIDAADKVYTGYGEWDSTDLPEPVSSFVYQDTDSDSDGTTETYAAFYWDVQKAATAKNGTKGYVVVSIGGVNYQFIVDFHYVDMVTASEDAPDIHWEGVTIEEIKDIYLFGLSLQDQNGNPFSTNFYVHYINAAIDWLENFLDINIMERTYEDERHDYIRDDYRNWGYVGLDHVPVKAEPNPHVTLLYGQAPSIEIPDDWVQLNRLTGQITLFPSAGSASQLIIGQTGLLFGFQSMWDYAPQLWQIKYTTGIDINDTTVPVDLIKEAIYKRASCGIMNVIGDLIIGAGIASQSVSIDGVSQSIGTTQSAMYGGMSARVNAYQDDLKDYILPILRQKFGGIRMTVV